MEVASGHRNEEEDRKRNEISRWLIDICDMVPEKALAVQHQLCEEFCHTSVRAVQEMLEIMPELLAHLKLPEPTRMRLENKIRSYNTKRIERLTRSEVQVVLDWFYMGEDYGSKIASHGVNGFVLSTTASLDRLKDWGVTDPLHASDINARIIQWKKHGVPRDFLMALSTAEEGEGEVSVNSETNSTIGMKRGREPTIAVADTVGQEPSTGVNDVSGEEDGHNGTSATQLGAKRSKSDAPIVESSPATKTAADGDGNRDCYGDGEQTADSDGESEEEGSCSAAAAVTNKASARAAAKPKGRRLSRELESLKRWSLYDPLKRAVPTPAPVATTRARRTKSAQAKAIAPAGSSALTTTVPTTATALTTTASSGRQPTTGSSSSSNSAQPVAPRVAFAVNAAPSATVTQPKVKQEGQQSRTIDCKQLLRGLSSSDAAVRVDSLLQVSKEIDKDRGSAASFVASGVYDRILVIMASPELETNEEVVWRALVAVNNSIALCGPAIVKYLVDKGVIGRVRPLCTSMKIRWRLQALWTLGNIAAVSGTHAFKEAVVSDDTVRAVLQGYATIDRAEGTPPEDVRCRYAETIQQFASQCTPAQAQRLILLRGILVDLITTQVTAKTVHHAAAAVCCLLTAKADACTATDDGIVAALLGAGIIEALVSRLQDTKVTIVQDALQALYNMVEGCSTHGDQLYELKPIVAHLGRFILWARTGSGNDRVSRLALECVRLLSEGGPESVKLVNMNDPRLYDELWEMVCTAIRNKDAIDPNGDKKAVAAAQALLIAVPRAAPDDWLDFVKQGVYNLAFEVLVAFERSHEVVYAALQVLENMLDQGIDRLTGTMKDWQAVKSLTALMEAGSNTKGVSAQQLENSEVARRLWNAARDLGVV